MGIAYSTPPPPKNTKLSNIKELNMSIGRVIEDSLKRWHNRKAGAGSAHSTLRTEG